MKTTTLLSVMFIAAALAGPAEAIYKCTTSKGVVYQDRPCTEGDESDVRLVIPTGGVAPKNLTSPDNGSPGGAARNDSRPGAEAEQPALINFAGKAPDFLAGRRVKAIETFVAGAKIDFAGDHGRARFGLLGVNESATGGQRSSTLKHVIDLIDLVVHERVRVGARPLDHSHT